MISLYGFQLALNVNVDKLLIMSDIFHQMQFPWEG